MSQSEHFHGNPVYGQTPWKIRRSLNACVHCKDKPFIVRDSTVFHVLYAKLQIWPVRNGCCHVLMSVWGR